MHDRPDSDTPVRVGLRTVDDVGYQTVTIRKALKARGGGNTTYAPHRTVPAQTDGIASSRGSARLKEIGELISQPAKARYLGFFPELPALEFRSPFLYEGLHALARIARFHGSSE